MKKMIALAGAFLLAACSTKGMVEVRQPNDANMSCAAILAELAANEVRIETTAQRSMNMLSGSFWVEDQASKVSALMERNRHLQALAAERNCR